MSTQEINPNAGENAGENEDQDIAIRVRGLTVGFGETSVLENLDIDIRRGELIMSGLSISGCMVGRNTDRATM